jgi:hypothetical protein
MSEDFSGGSRIAWTVLDPRTGTSHIIDPQYERERRTAKATPSPRKPYARQVDELADAILKAAGLSFVKQP